MAQLGERCGSPAKSTGRYGNTELHFDVALMMMTAIYILKNTRRPQLSKYGGGLGNCIKCLVFNSSGINQPWSWEYWCNWWKIEEYQHYHYKGKCLPIENSQSIVQINYQTRRLMGRTGFALVLNMSIINLLITTLACFSAILDNWPTRDITLYKIDHSYSNKALTKG